MAQREHVPTPLIHASEREPIEVIPAPVDGSWRIARALGAISMLLLGLAVDVLRRRSGRDRAIRIRRFIEGIGGLWIKFGQLIALRQDVFGFDLADELSRLHDRTQGFAFESVRASLEERLGRPLSSVFSEFDEAPIAAASIGQAHLARLRFEKKRVIVKVLKPNAQAMFRKDLALITGLVAVLRRLPSLSYMMWGAFMRELESIFLEELDYRYEMTSIRRMRKVLKPHGILGPRVYRRYCNDLMLTMEYLEGVLMTDVIKIARSDPERVAAWYAANDIEPRKVARRLVLTTMRQVFEDNFFHGDLHPGNIMLFRGSKVGLIDFGSVGKLDVEFKEKYEMLLVAMLRGEYHKATDLLLLMTSNLPLMDLPDVRAEMVHCMRRWEARTLVESLPYHEKSLAAFTNEISNVLSGRRIEPNWTLLKIGRMWTTLDASLNYLDPALNYLKIFRKYGKQRARRTRFKLGEAFANVSRTFGESMSHMSPMIREKALIFRSTAGKAARVFRLVVGFTRLLLPAAAIFLLWWYASHHHPDHPIEDGLDSILTPIFGPGVEQWLHEAVVHEGLWVLILLGLIVVWGGLRRIHSILREPDRRKI